MVNQSFDDFVNRQAAEAQETEIDWEARLKEWKRYLQEFYELVEKHLHKYVSEGKISLDYSEKTIEEERLGTYSARSLTVSIGKKVRGETEVR